MTAKHFMIYYQRGTGTYVVTEPRPWARENQHHILDYTFQSDNQPTTDVIEAWLIENRQFIRILDNDLVSLVQNIEPNLDL